MGKPIEITKKKLKISSEISNLEMPYEKNPQITYWPNIRNTSKNLTNFSAMFLFECQINPKA